MKFRTEINIPAAGFNVGYQNRILTIGSCFAENIAAKLKRSRFLVDDNPFGVLYNPVSIFNSLDLVKTGKKFTHEDLIFDQDEYHSFHHHSSFSSHDKTEVLENINTGLQSLAESLPDTDFAFVSLGTSFIYDHKELAITVSNCHKIPQKHFIRRRLSTMETIQHLRKIVDTLHSFNPGMKIIFTVSPVRHLKDGAAENNRSKAALLLAVEEIVNTNENIEYFPSYELLLDDLRDYRFYAWDLVHPSDAATEYIWEKFSDTYFDDSVKKLKEKIISIVSARNHRVRNPRSPQYEKFLRAHIKKIEELLNRYPYLRLKDDLRHFSQNLEKYFG